MDNASNQIIFSNVRLRPLSKYMDVRIWVASWTTHHVFFFF